MKGLALILANLLIAQAARGDDLFQMRTNPSVEIQEQMNAMEKDRDLRKFHGQSSLISESDYHSRNREVADRIFKEYQNAQLRHFGDQVSTYFLSRDLGAFRTPVAAMVFVAGVYAGKEVKKNFGSGAQLRFRTDVRRKGGHTLRMESQIVNGEIAFQTAEGQKVNLSREIPLAHINTGVEYNLTNHSIATSASRNLTPGLDLIVAHNRAQESEQSVRLVYGIRF